MIARVYHAFGAAGNHLIDTARAGVPGYASASVFASRASAVSREIARKYFFR
jgi:hypothetical protein